MSSSPFVDKALTLSKKLCGYLAETDIYAAQDDVVSAYHDFFQMARERIRMGDAGADTGEAVIDWHRRGNALVERHRQKFEAHFPPSVADHYIDRIAAEVHKSARLNRTEPAPPHFEIGRALYDDATPPRPILPGARKDYPPWHVMGCSNEIFTPGKFLGLRLIRLENLDSDQRRDLAGSIFSSIDRFSASLSRQHDDVIANRQTIGEWARKLVTKRPSEYDRLLKRGHASHLSIRDDVEAAFKRGGASADDARTLADQIWQRCASAYGLAHDSSCYTGPNHHFGEYVRPHPYTEWHVPKGHVVPVIRPPSNGRDR